MFENSAICCSSSIDWQTQGRGKFHPSFYFDLQLLSTFSPLLLLLPYIIQGRPPVEQELGLGKGGGEHGFPIFVIIGGGGGLRDGARRGRRKEEEGNQGTPRPEKRKRREEGG